MKKRSIYGLICIIVGVDSDGDIWLVEHNPVENWYRSKCWQEAYAPITSFEETKLCPGFTLKRAIEWFKENEKPEIKEHGIYFLQTEVG